MRAGIAGSGFAAEFHVAGLKGCAGLGVQPAAVYSPHAGRRAAFSARHRLAAAASLEELLGQVDAVHVCAPPATHEEIACAALEAGVHAIVEKPFTGCFAEADTPRAQMEAAAVASARRMLAAEQASGATLGYAENWVFAPAVQKEAEIVRKSRAQILRMAGEESHSGSHSPVYGTLRRRPPLLCRGAELLPGTPIDSRSHYCHNPCGTGPWAHRRGKVWSPAWML